MQPPEAQGNAPTHEWGCVLDHDPEDDCMTVEDLRDERALAKAEALADDLGGWRHLR